MNHNRSAPVLNSPTVRVQQSSPIATTQQPSMLAHGSVVGCANDGYHSGGYLSALPRAFQDLRYHKRGSSGSSVTSAGPPSPLTHNTIYPHIATSDAATFSPSYDFDYYSPVPHTAKSLPTSGTDSSLMYSNANRGYGAVDMRRIHSTGATTVGSTAADPERASYPLSGAQSVSTMSHPSPATPHTNYDADFDDSKNLYGYPTAAYQQSLHEVFPDHHFGQSMGYPQAQSLQRMNAQPRPNMMADRLQAAQQDHLRTESPTSNPRDKSPFRQNSPYNLPAAVARPPPTVPTLHKTRTSISPKELMLDEHDIDEPTTATAATPLFPDPSMFAPRRNPSNLSNFYAAGFHGEPSMQMSQQYPFVSQPSRQSGQSGLSEVTPDFPAHMLSMESTGEEGGPAASHPPPPPTVATQTASSQTSVAQQRPRVDTSSDSGTYSCTYHGCTLRFDTPAKLQKHKREGHRHVSPGSVSSPNLALRNSQAGPHRCDRINPSTGKPCHSVFSRPYDLTRHEDTIHNARKQKVRCHLCTEEKTFSRNDALTRHMRVVHPDVDWVGKQKRKSHK